MNNLFNEARQIVINAMVDHGVLIRAGDDHYEDMGGHTLHESWLDDYITEFLKELPKDELTELMTKIKGDI
jgi:hypothetical protein